MGGDEGSHLMFFPGLMQMRQGSNVSHAYSSLPGFPPQVHLPMMLGAYPPPPTPGPGAYTCARPGYAYAQAHSSFAYPPPPPPPPPGPYAYPPQGYPYPYPGSPAPHQDYGSSGHGGARQMEKMESKPKGGGTTTTASATAAYGGISHGSGGHGSGRQVEVMETAPKSGSAATSSASAYGAINNLFRGHGRNGSFGFFGNCCGDHNRGTSSFKHAAGHGHQGKFKSGHRPGKVEHVHGKFRAKRTTWKY